ncbi:MAG: helix-turn-helix transcriptional regulator [Deltaproteobacteria bacterium]|jgi:transcriptional regulator with XRE-family HTH domain|nr:helix-turn-helix transcriptional regulator [Deltaproteobacteria bacterium]
MGAQAASRLARNIRQLRDARGLTQAQAAKLAGVPRATWGNLESGEANPTLAVLTAVGEALQVSLEELVSAPRAGTRFFPRAELPERVQGHATVRKLLPEKLPGLDLERLELPPRGRMAGVPHTTGAREYLTCERGSLTLAVAGKVWTLGPGDVVVFRGDQRHGYGNPGEEPAVGYSVILLEPVR